MFPNPKVKVMLITTNEKVAGDLANGLSAEYADIPARFDICDTECAECLLSDDCPEADLFNHDLYICFQEGRFTRSNQILKFLKVLRQTCSNADIFVVSQGKDPFLLEELLKIGVEGVIDMDHPNYSGVICSIKTLNEIYTKFAAMIQKLESISICNKVCE